MLNREKVRKMRQEKRLEVETSLLKSINHPHICRLFDEMQDDNAFYLLLEFVQGGELKRLIHPSESHLRKHQQLDAEAGICAGIPHQAAKFYAAVVSIPLVFLHRCIFCFFCFFVFFVLLSVSCRQRDREM
jgi:serine/threonine protein kinase